MDKQEQSLNSLNREKYRLQSSRMLSNPLAVFREPTTNTHGYLTYLELPHLTPAATLIQSVPIPHITAGQFRALRRHVSKHSRRTTDKNLRTKHWRGLSSVLMEHRSHSLFSSTRKKY
jgi:hypothetical protein